MVGMTLLDVAVIGIVGLTTLLALVRGFVREAIALAAWFLAFWMALQFSGAVGDLLAGAIANPTVRWVLALAGVFLITLIAAGLAGRVLSKLVHLAGLGLADRLLGALFGVLKGSILVLVLGVVAGLTSLPQQPWWQQSLLGGWLAGSALALRPWLPPALAERLHYGPAQAYRELPVPAPGAERIKA